MSLVCYSMTSYVRFVNLGKQVVFSLVLERCLCNWTHTLRHSHKRDGCFTLNAPPLSRSPKPTTQKNGVAKAELTRFPHTSTAICVVADWWLTTTTCDSLISFERFVTRKLIHHPQEALYVWGHLRLGWEIEIGGAIFLRLKQPSLLWLWLRPF